MSDSGFPILVLLKGRRCVVVGGGRVAERKIQALLDAGGHVHVIAPKLTDALGDRLSRGEVEVSQRVYENGDLEGAFLAVAATDIAEVNEQVWREAEARNLLINTVDDPPRCNFYLPAVVRRGDLTIAVSTNGKSCALAARIRRDLEKRYSTDYAPYLALLGELRAEMIKNVPDPMLRKRIAYGLADSDLLAVCAEGDQEAANRRALEIIDGLSAGCVQG